MIRSLIAVAAGLSLGIGGMCAAHHEGGEHVRPLSSREILEKLDGKATNATVVEVSLKAGAQGSPHRHPGPVFGYVLEGEYELGIDDQPPKIYKQGETFYEPTGCLHSVSRNPSMTGPTRLLAVVLHPRDVKEVAVPEHDDQ